MTFATFNPYYQRIPPIECGVFPLYCQSKTVANSSLIRRDEVDIDFGITMSKTPTEYNPDGEMPYHQGTMLDMLLMGSKLPTHSQLHLWLSDLRIPQMVRNKRKVYGRINLRLCSRQALPASIRVLWTRQDSIPKTSLRFKLRKSALSSERDVSPSRFDHRTRQQWPW